MKCSRFILIAVAFLFSALPVVSAFAAASAKVHVSATVLPYVDFTATQNVHTYQVRNEDLQRGYVDLPDSITVNLRTNVQNSVNLMIENWGSGKVLVRESGSFDFTGSQLTLNSAGYRRGETVSKRYDSRIILPADAQEGNFQFAIAMLAAQ